MCISFVKISNIVYFCSKDHDFDDSESEMVSLFINCLPIWVMWKMTKTIDDKVSYSVDRVWDLQGQEFMSPLFLM